MGTFVADVRRRSSKGVVPTTKRAPEKLFGARKLNFFLSFTCAWAVDSDGSIHRGRRLELMPVVGLRWFSFRCFSKNSARRAVSPKQYVCLKTGSVRKPRITATVCKDLQRNTCNHMCVFTNHRVRAKFDMFTGQTRSQE